MSGTEVPDCGRGVRFAPVSQQAAEDWIKVTHRDLPVPPGDLYRIGLEIHGRLVAAASPAGRAGCCRMAGRWN